MARRGARGALIAIVGAAACLAPLPALERDGVLVAYSFEEDGLATGPDTFSVFRNARGKVELSQEMALSGRASIRIEDVPGDGDFPELQGYFPLRRQGKLFLHFALLVAEPDQELDIALAGPRGFVLGPDGIAFWLQVVGGELRHVSDSIPRRLVRVRPFVWYALDAAIDLTAGRYDLTIHEEGLSEPVVRIAGAPAAAAQPGSAVQMFSFIGDLADASSTVYYVDDVLVGVDDRVTTVPFVAPGRRRLFFDRCWRPGAPATPRASCPERARPDDSPALAFEAAMAANHAQQALELASERLADPQLEIADRGVWRERAAAAAYFLGMRSDAEQLLDAAVREAPARSSILVALADLALLRGDLDAERAFREAVYGSLAPSD